MSPSFKRLKKSPTRLPRDQLLEASCLPALTFPCQEVGCSRSGCRGSVRLFPHRSCHHSVPCCLLHPLPRCYCLLSVHTNIDTCQSWCLAGKDNGGCMGVLGYMCRLDNRGCIRRRFGLRLNATQCVEPVVFCCVVCSGGAGALVTTYASSGD
jgi:hypothetical protein